MGCQQERKARHSRQEMADTPAFASNIERLKPDTNWEYRNKNIFPNAVDIQENVYYCA